MLITVHVTGLDDLVAAIKKLSEVSLYNVQLLQAPHPTAEQAIPTPAPKAKAKPAAPIAEPAPEPAPEPAAATLSPFDEAKRLVLEISRVKGRDAASTLLESFGAKRLTEVSADNLQVLIEDATELLGAA